jgi:hypothetical protein
MAGADRGDPHARRGVNMRAIVGARDLVLVTLDTLRYDVAARAFREGRTPHFAGMFPGGWEERHSPSTFTFGAHASFFAGFLPTPIAPGRHPRAFALRFEGSETTDDHTAVLDGASIPEGLSKIGYRTVCIGGTGFFNLANPLGRALPSLFDEAHWEPRFGVTDPRSFEHQIERVEEIALRVQERIFLFVNVSALHQPNRFYLEGAREDSIASHAAALEYVDRQLPRLLAALRRPSYLIVCSDHGTAYGEDGYSGHRVAHPCVWTVPYAEAAWR